MSYRRSVSVPAAPFVSRLRGYSRGNDRLGAAERAWASSELGVGASVTPGALPCARGRTGRTACFSLCLGIGAVPLRNDRTDSWICVGEAVSYGGSRVTW